MSSLFLIHRPMIVALALLLGQLPACQKDQHTRQVRSKPSAELQAGTEYADKMAQLQLLQERIAKDPVQPALRQALLEEAIDISARKMYALGLGKPQPDSKSPAAAQQAAERAAYLDGCRWLAYINAWRLDIHTPDFGNLQAAISGARLVQRNATPEQTLVLVEMDF